MKDPRGARVKPQAMSKIVLVGAGSAQFGYGTLGEVFSSESLRECEVVLLDINPEALKVVQDTARGYIEANGIPTRVSATTDRAKAFAGADFVIISIEVGDRFELWDMDRTIPQQYGIKQVFGENGGPGGLFHSLRIIPPILEICRDVQRICPEAWVFNYSNPMSRICTTVRRELPDVKLIGLCHEVASLERYLPGILETSYHTLQVTAGGLNHFSCLLDVRYSDGRDAYPDVRIKTPGYLAHVPGASDYLRHYTETGDFVQTEGATKIHAAVTRSAREWVERKLFEFVLQTYDLLPITVDSHFGEYLPWAYEVVDHRGIMDFYHYYRLVLSRAEPRIELGTRERVVPMMEALSGSIEPYREAAVNIPNAGYIRELPQELCVEVPAMIGKDSVMGERLEPIPKAFAALLQNQVGIHEMTAEAVLSGKRKSVVQALLADPIVDRARNLGEMVDLMIRIQRPYLNYLT
jgi:alpha-galactosidase